MARMRVKELIQLLNQVDPDSYVVTHTQEDIETWRLGFVDCVQPCRIITENTSSGETEYYEDYACVADKRDMKADWLTKEPAIYIGLKRDFT